MEDKRIFLLDAYALIFRGYYAFIKRPMINSKGLNTSAIFGFTRTLLDVLKRERPTHIAVAFDEGLTFRHRLFSEYKANRPETPEAIRLAVPRIQEILEAMHIPILKSPGFEADDVIGTLAKRAEKNGYQVFMMTPDKDFGQLVSPNIRMYKPGRSGGEVEIWGPEEVCKHYGLQRPEQVIDMLALWGDASDNIPGAPGIGEKTAQKLLETYDNLENLIAHAQELKPKFAAAIGENVERLRMSKVLATIALDVPIEVNEEDLRLDKPNLTTLQSLMQTLEFHTLQQDLIRWAEKPFTHNDRASRTSGQVPTTSEDTAPRMIQTSLFDFSETPEAVGEAVSAPAPVPSVQSVERPLLSVADVPVQYHLVEKESELTALCNRLLRAQAFAIDTETTGLDTNQADLVGLSVSMDPYEAYYIPMNTEHAKARLECLRPALEHPEIVKIGQNIKFDYVMLCRNGVRLGGRFWDTMIVHYLHDPEQKHNMDYLAEIYLRYRPIPITDLIGSGKAAIRMDQVPLETLTRYAAEDADVTLRLKMAMEPILEDETTARLYWEVEEPLIRVLAEMEMTGVYVDMDALETIAGSLRQELIELEKQVCDMAGEPNLNVHSPKQLGDILFGKLKLDGQARTTGKTKQYSTSEETLLALKDKHPIVEAILSMRGVKKLLSTYVEALPELINPRTRRIHTSFNQAVTATGRLSSTNPNLQNIPIRDAKGREVRKAFSTPSADRCILSADYSQIELRIMAHLSEDEHLIEAFGQGLDIHTATAARIYQVSLDQVSKAQRSHAKTANFGIIYGISAFGLAQRLGISRSEAKALIDGYFVSYPKVKIYMDTAIREAREKGYVETILGRKRILRDIQSANPVVRGYAERNAINAPIQGSSADLIKLAMVRIHRRLQAEHFVSKMILQVHDELVFEADIQELEALKAVVMEEMQAALSLRVPLLAEAGVGKNWLEAH